MKVWVLTDIDMKSAVFSTREKAFEEAQRRIWEDGGTFSRTDSAGITMFLDEKTGWAFQVAEREVC